MKKLILSVLTVTFLLFGCNLQSNTTDNGKPGEILIDLEKDLQPTVIEEQFSNYNLKQVKTVSPSLNIVLFSFDSEKVKIEKLLKKIKKTEGVENAQSNKTIKNRG